jgi:hypothetical protein
MFTSVSKVPQIGHFSAKSLHVAMFVREARLPGLLRAKCAAFSLG